MPYVRMALRPGTYVLVNPYHEHWPDVLLAPPDILCMEGDMERSQVGIGILNRTGEAQEEFPNILCTQFVMRRKIIDNDPSKYPALDGSGTYQGVFFSFRTRTAQSKEEMDKIYEILDAENVPKEWISMHCLLSGFRLKTETEMADSAA